MYSFESFPPPHKQDVETESDVETPEDLAAWLMKEWEHCLESIESRKGQAQGETEVDLDASDMALEHLDQLSEDLVLDHWRDGVPDQMKPGVAAILRRDADPKLVRLLDNYAGSFREQR